jgi:glyoxylase I family protein
MTMSNCIVAVLFGLVLMAIVGQGHQSPASQPSAEPDDQGKGNASAFRAGAVRYQVADVDRSVAFYTKHLGFKVELQFEGAPFASVSNGNLTLWLSGPESSGARPLPDGRKQEPGGWNRIVLEVDELPTQVAELKNAGLRFRNEIVEGPGGRQIQMEDPDGNPIELFQPAK